MKNDLSVGDIVRFSHTTGYHEVTDAADTDYISTKQVCTDNLKPTPGRKRRVSRGLVSLVMTDKLMTGLYALWHQDFNSLLVRVKKSNYNKGQK